ncbi:DUF4129 domain-containing protein, partial [Candidatus Sumerlaeota bacterium]|nr:DUF4129 domain-containing protein [Candidatus Sumerlaeota bacterium]
MSVLYSTHAESHPREAPHLTGKRPGLFTHLYLALFVQGSLLIYAVYGESVDHRPWMLPLLLSLGLTTLLAFGLRRLLMDWYAAMSHSGRFLHFFWVMSLFLLPGAMRSHTILPEGFALALPMVMLFAVNEVMVRRMLALTVLGFWFALSSPEEPGLLIVVGFGVSTLWALSCAHFAFLGHPFGLGGWWPARRIARAVVLCSIPAAVAAQFVYRFWRPPSEPGPAPISEPLSTGLRSPGTFDPERLGLALLRLAFWLIVVIICLLTLHFFRRLQSRRARAVNLPQLRGADLSEVEFKPRETSRRRRELGGRRGQVVRLWQRWARSTVARGEDRSPSETAAELARRVEQSQDCDARAGDLTRLFE